jgi:hypothetical protein
MRSILDLLNTGHTNREEQTKLAAMKLFVGNNLFDSKDLRAAFD